MTLILGIILVRAEFAQLSDMKTIRKKNLFLIAETAGPGEGRQNIQLGAAGSYFRADLSGLDSAVRGEGGRTAL